MIRTQHLIIASLFLTACSAGGTAITTFEECIAAGNPILESYPEQCRTPDGKVFTKDTQKEDRIHVTNLKPGDVIHEDVIVLGEARGTWYFEASFPVELLDANGNVLAQVPAQAQGDWMTEDFVPFKAEFSVDFGGAKSGMLVLHRDNPSGLPQNEAEIQIPLVFQSTR